MFEVENTKRTAVHFKVSKQDEGKKLGNYLRCHDVSVTLIRRLKHVPNGILLNNESARTNQIVEVFDDVAITMPEETDFSALPQSTDVKILYETLHTVVFDKPAGMLTHPTGRHRENTLANAYCGLMQKRGHAGAQFRPIGRLDANTSGAVLCAKNPYVAPILAKNMAKIYFALVQGLILPKKGVIDAPLAACEGSAVLQEVSSLGKQSKTEYEVISQNDEMSFVKVRPLTGRTHQIRAHFAYAGHILCGDELYGADAHIIKRHALHCAVVSFEEPQRGSITVESALPCDMQNVLDLGEFDFHKIY